MQSVLQLSPLSSQWLRHISISPSLVHTLSIFVLSANAHPLLHINPNISITITLLLISLYSTKFVNNPNTICFSALSQYLFHTCYLANFRFRSKPLTVAFWNFAHLAHLINCACADRNGVCAVNFFLSAQNAVSVITK